MYVPTFSRFRCWKAWYIPMIDSTTACSPPAAPSPEQQSGPEAQDERSAAEASARSLIGHRATKSQRRNLCSVARRLCGQSRSGRIGPPSVRDDREEIPPPQFLTPLEERQFREHGAAGHHAADLLHELARPDHRA